MNRYAGESIGGGGGVEKPRCQVAKERCVAPLRSDHKLECVLSAQDGGGEVQTLLYMPARFEPLYDPWMSLA